MISESQLKRFCCGDPTEIENYSDAINDTTQKWECHHRKELTEDGEFAYSVKDLIKMKEYYDRPPSELIFLTASEHRSLHHKGKKLSAATREKMSVAKKGSKSPFYGQAHSDDSKEKMSKSLTGIPRKTFTDEHCENLSKSLKGRKCSNGSLGMHWYNNGIENKLTYDCPEGFVKGRLINK